MATCGTGACATLAARVTSLQEPRVLQAGGTRVAALDISPGVFFGLKPTPNKRNSTGRSRRDTQCVP